jgi:hypothetical protein
MMLQTAEIPCFMTVTPAQRSETACRLPRTAFRNSCQLLKELFLCINGPISPISPFQAFSLIESHAWVILMSPCIFYTLSRKHNAGFYSADRAYAVVEKELSGLRLTPMKIRKIKIGLSKFKMTKNKANLIGMLLSGHDNDSFMYDFEMKTLDVNAVIRY